jgi:hypothetical protein
LVLPLDPWIPDDIGGVKWRKGRAKISARQ